MFGRAMAPGLPSATPLVRLAMGVVVAGCLCPPPARAQRLPITLYTVRDGLPHYVVHRIVRDSRGFLWFCTREGLARFDGREFERFGTEQGLPSATVNDLVEAPDGTYWVATTGGLVHFDPRGRRRAPGAPTMTQTAAGRPMFTVYRPGPDPRAVNVTRLTSDPSGGVWVGTSSGLYRVRVAPTGTELAYVDLNIADELQARGVSALLVDRTGALWISAARRLYRRAVDGAVETVGEAEGLPSVTTADMLEDRTGRIWLGTTAGLHWLEPDSARGRRAVRAAGRYGRPDLLVSSLLHDRRGALWAGTNGGLVQIAPDGDATDPSGRVIAEDQGLPGHEVQGLAEDDHGNVWAGVLPFGAAKVSSNGFTSFRLPKPRTFPSTLLETRDGRLVVVGAAAGRWSISRFGRGRFTEVPGARPSATPAWGWNQVAFQDRSGSWWFGGNEGVSRYAPGVELDDLTRAAPSARFSRANGLPADVVIRLFEDARGDVWISTVGHGVRPNGLSVWRRDASPPLTHFTERDGLPPLDQFYASSFASDRRGHLWIGFSGSAGLVHYDGAVFTRVTAEHGVPPGQIRNLLVDARGRLWAATYRGGVCRLDDPDARPPSVRTYTTADGLSSNETHALVESANGDVYVGTARGIHRLAASSGRWTHYTQDDGLPPGEMQGALRDRNGTLWFTYNDDVLRLVPAIDAPAALPPILITSLTAAGREQPVSAVGQQHADRLVVPGGATLRIGFVAPWFGGRSDLSYHYRLEGADRGWNGPTDQRSVTYASLAPGAYTFMVRPSSDGIAGPTVASVPITVVPPFWQRRSFQAPAAAGLGLLAYAAYRLRLRRAIDFANLRTRIATDLHDDIGANLTRIGILSEVVRHQFSERGLPDDSRLSAIARLARESVGAMSDIVWAINPRRDTLLDLSRKLRDVAEDITAACDVEVDVVLPDAGSTVRLDMDVRRDLLLICKEALNNAVRHARCRRLRVELRIAGGSLTLAVVDDGLGFDPSRVCEGNGMASIRRRAGRIGASLVVDSAPGSGTAVRLSLPQGRWRWRRRAPTQLGR